MPNRTREEIHRLHADLYKLVKHHPSSEGMNLLERFEKVLLNGDLLIGSKSALKEKTSVIVVNEDNCSKNFEINIRMRRKLSKMDAMYISEEEFKRLMTEEFVLILEDNFLNKML